MVLGPDLMVGVLDFIDWIWFWIQILWFWVVLCGSGSRFNGWGPGFYWLELVLLRDLIVLFGFDWFWVQI